MKGREAGGGGAFSTGDGLRSAEACWGPDRAGPARRPLSPAALTCPGLGWYVGTKVGGVCWLGGC